MQFQFDIASSANKAPAQIPANVVESVPELLKQILEIQREGFTRMLEFQKAHLDHIRAMTHENVARWRSVLTRCQDEQPDLAEHCQVAFPAMERAFLQLLAKMTEELSDADSETLTNEFALQEFIDRYGMRVGQLSHLLSIVGPMAEAAHQLEEAARQQSQQSPPEAQG